MDRNLLLSSIQKKLEELKAVTLATTTTNFSFLGRLCHHSRRQQSYVNPARIEFYILHSTLLVFGLAWFPDCLVLFYY